MNNLKEYTGKAVKIMTCSNCNMKCKQCYVNYEGNFDASELKGLVEELNKKYQVRLNGTEPLLHPDFLDSFKISKEELVLTNGFVLKNDISMVDKIIASGVKRICMSYQYGVQSTLDSVKLNYLDDLFPRVREKGIDVEMMCIISSQNYNLIEDICKKALELKANYLYFIEYMHQGKAKENLNNKLSLTPKQRKEFFKQLNEIRKKYNQNELYIYRSGNFGKDTYTGKEVQCDAGRDIVTMTPDYKIYPCNFLIEEQYCLGYCKDRKIYIDEGKRDLICNGCKGCLWKCLKG